MSRFVGGSKKQEPPIFDLLKYFWLLNHMAGRYYAETLCASFLSTNWKFSTVEILVWSVNSIFSDRTVSLSQESPMVHYELATFEKHGLLVLGNQPMCVETACKSQKLKQYLDRVLTHSKIRLR